MRFLLFDSVTHLEPGKSIEGTKCTTLTEEYLRGHFDRAARMPGSLIVESMIQLLAWAAIAKHNYRVSAVLTILEDVTVPIDVSPGKVLNLKGTLQGTNRSGSVGLATAHIDGQEVARVGRVVYGHAPHLEPEVLKARFRYFGGSPE